MIRGGISVIFQGNAEANSQLLKSYVNSKPKKWIIGEDATNLSWHSKMQALPFQVLGWVDPEK